jgi:carboxyl-terminal processing protease
MQLMTLLFSCQVAFCLVAPAASVEDALITTRHTNATPLIAGPDDSNIVKWVGLILEKSHYNRRLFDQEVSSKLLDRYLDALDPQHLYFTQSDLQQFEAYRNRLHSLTMKAGDASPARVIFNRFRERLDQQVSYNSELLQSGKFDFTGDDRFLLNRRKEPRPKDLNEAHRLWRDRLRYEYLQEKLGIGRPEAISGIVLEKLKQKKPQNVVKALQDKVSKEKAEEIAKIVNERFKKEPPEATEQFLRAKLEKDNADEVVKIITRRYSRVQRTLRDYDNDDMLQVYLTALTHVYDPHSDYLGKAEFDNFAIVMSLKLFGIGAVLTSEDGYCKIRELKPGPAMNSKKLKPGDKIIAVAQSNQPPVDVVDMKLTKVVEQIRGPKGTEVRLTVIPADAPDPSVRKFVTLIRDEIKLEDGAAKARLIEVPADKSRNIRLGVIDLPSFYSSFELEGNKGEGGGKSTTADVAMLLDKLKREKVSGVILDLRRNGGGSLEEAIRLTGLFIKEGPVVQVRDTMGHKVVDKDPDSSLLYDGPLVVLTSRFSASASEILAGALQDYGRALVVGDSSTHGKGTVQSLIQLAPILRANAVSLNNNPGALKITIRKFYRVTGSSTQLKGVTPDIVLPSVNNCLEVGEAALDNPMPWDTTDAADYEKVNMVTPYLDSLRKRSEQRLPQDHDFTYIGEDIERYKKTQEDKTVSLNEALRLKEKTEADDRAKVRKKELAARPPSAETAYEITLKEAGLPGLPPPLGSTNQVKGTATNAPTRPEVAQASRGDGPEAKLDEEETAGDDKAPTVDPNLDECKRILIDWVTLSGRGFWLARTESAKSK